MLEKLNNFFYTSFFWKTIFNIILEVEQSCFAYTTTFHGKFSFIKQWLIKILNKLLIFLYVVINHFVITHFFFIFLFIFQLFCFFLFLEFVEFGFCHVQSFPFRPVICIYISISIIFISILQESTATIWIIRCSIIIYRWLIRILR